MYFPMPFASQNTWYNISVVVCFFDRNIIPQHGCYWKMTAVFFQKSIRKSFNSRMLFGGFFYSPLFCSVVLRPILIFTPAGLRGVARNENLPDALHRVGAHTLGNQPRLGFLGFRLPRKAVQLAPPLLKFGGEVAKSRPLRGKVGKQIVPRNVVIIRRL